MGIWVLISAMCIVTDGAFIHHPKIYCQVYKIYAYELHLKLLTPNKMTHYELHRTCSL